MRKFIDYLQSVKTEMMKVTWPTRDEVYSSTGLVVFFTIVITLMVWAFDWMVSVLVYNRVVG
ncbi:MAG: preprotein translocase subunit SecE [Fibrobacterota bacterium]|jgi:preprotein translocase subunit SecE